MMKTLIGYDLRALEIFSLVAELRSMSVAAGRLGMSQPAVSQAISNLEKVLGISLIDRSSRPLMLTAAGEWLFRSAGQLIQDATQIAATVRQFEEGNALRLRIGLVDSLSDPFVPAMVRRLSPSIHYISITSGLARTLTAGLVDRSLDLIITNDPMDDVKVSSKYPILTEPYFLVVPAAASSLSGNFTKFASTKPLIRWAARSRTGADIDGHLRRLKLDLSRQYEFESARTILGMVAAEQGWAIMTPLLIFDILPVLDKVRLLPFPGPGFSRTISVVTAQVENDALAERMARTSSRIISDLYIREIARVVPWLRCELDQNGYRMRLTVAQEAG